MVHDERQWPLERIVLGVDELKTVLGADAAVAVERVKLGLIQAMAARDRGDRDGTLRAIAGAMAELAQLGERLGSAEGAMMRAAAAGFVNGMAEDDRDAVERHLATIQSHAGTPTKSKND